VSRKETSEKAQTHLEGYSIFWGPLMILVGTAFVKKNDNHE
jgi:hypothetical protein